MGGKVKICVVVVLFLICLVSQVCFGDVKTFRCKDGRYILDNYFCDNHRLCADGEDEGYTYKDTANSSCQRASCGKAKFACDGGQCKNITVRCNTLKDCNDGTDELNCGDEVNTKNCTSKDKFLCYDGLRCLDLLLTCNGDCNCFDCSDENSNCAKHDADLVKRCPQTYFHTAKGPLCLCDSKENQSHRICNALEFCPDYYDCDQYCIKYDWNVKHCSCYEGFHPITTDGSKCRANDWYGNVIFYSTTLKINSLNLTSNLTHEQSALVQTAADVVSALAAANNYVYYATLSLDNRGRLFKSPFTPGDSDVVQIVQTDFPITSIAVDYATNNVYFTSNGSLSVCSSDGRICLKLKCCGINYVAIAPKSGWMFYIQLRSDSQNENILMRSHMDGSNETIFGDEVYRSSNMSIAIDESKSKVYLLVPSNDKVYIIEISFDGFFKESISRPKPGVHSLAVLNGDVFFTVNEKNDIIHTTIFRKLTSINTNVNLFFQDSGPSPAKYLFAYNAKLQTHNENPCNKSSCSGLCLIKPTISTSFSYTCVCNDFTPTSDNHWCSTNPVQASVHGIIWIILGISILTILAGTGYYMFHKRDWYGYRLGLRLRGRRWHDQRITIK